MAKNKNKASHPTSEEESAVAEETKEETTEQPVAEENAESKAEGAQSAAADEAVEQSAEQSDASGDEPSHEESEEAGVADEAALVLSKGDDLVVQPETTTALVETPAPEEVVVAVVTTTVVEQTIVVVTSAHEEVEGYLAYFDYPDELLHAAGVACEAGYKDFDAYSPFPIHGMDDALGLGRSWLPWVTFAAGLTGFTLANAMQFGMLTFDWPMIIGGKPYAPWPSFVPIMFELTVLIGGVTTALVMLIAARCFRRNRIMDPGFTDDRFALWISAEDARFEDASVREFMESLHPVEIRPVHRETT